MTRRQKDPLRPLTSEERRWLARVARSHAEPASHVARAKALLAVADGMSYTQAAKAAGRRSGDAVSNLVWRFNREGLRALEPGHGGGPTPTYTSEECERILAEARRAPDREKDGTAEWSLTTLRRSLRGAPEGLPSVSTHTIWKVLHEAGFSWQKDRSWCESGKVERKRKDGEVVEVTDPDAQPKKSWSSAPTWKGSASWEWRYGAKTRLVLTKRHPTQVRAGSHEGDHHDDLTSTCAGERQSF